MCTLRETTSVRFLKLLYYQLETNINEDFLNILVKTEKLDINNANMQGV